MKNSTNHSLSDIHVYQDAVSMTETIFTLSKGSTLDPVLAEQLRKATVGLCANIVQGYRSRRKPVFADFLYQALGSGNRIYALLDIAERVSPTDGLTDLKEQALVINKKMFAFRKTLLETKEEREKRKQEKAEKANS